MINGDQHLATVLQHGVDAFGDAGFSFSVPSIVNHYRRWWSPDQKASKNKEGDLAYTGEYLDNFGNKITMHAYANPNPTRTTYNRWLSQGAGFGIIRFNKRNRTITMECWPRGCDLTNPECQQFPGWPLTISQEENYRPGAGVFLPPLQFLDVQDPVIQVINESTGEIIYTLRIQGKSYQPKVLQEGTYTIKIRSEGKQIMLTDIKASSDREMESVQIELRKQEGSP